MIIRRCQTLYLDQAKPVAEKDQRIVPSVLS